MNEATETTKKPEIIQVTLGSYRLAIVSDGVVIEWLSTPHRSRQACFEERARARRAAVRGKTVKETT